jgi:hypothetical protein
MMSFWRSVATKNPGGEVILMHKIPLSPLANVMDSQYRSYKNLPRVGRVGC